MEVIVLGSGTGWPRLDRSSPSYLVNIDNFLIMLDIGPNSIKQLLKCKYSINDISAIFISHFHPDHITDLIPFLFAIKYSMEFTRKEKIYIITHKNFKTFYQKINEAFNYHLTPPENLIEFKLIPNESLFYELNINDIKLKTAKVKHNEESIAIRIEHKNKSIVYSGDTAYNLQLVELSRNCDLLLIECSNGNFFQTEDHLNIEEVKKIIIEAQPKRVIITHLYPHSENIEIEKIKEYSNHISIEIAKDLMKVEI